jgi:hypothetical protein
MVDIKAAIKQELTRLRHGWGLESTDLRHRLGAHTSVLFDILPADSDRAIRIKVRTTLRRLSRDFPRPDQLAITLAFGLEPGTQHAQLNQRVDLLAAQLHVAERTARRRIDRACDRLAEEAATEAQHSEEEVEDPDRGWYVRRLEVLLRLDTAAPTLIEKRTIVALRDNLKKITARFSLPQPLTGEHGPREALADVQRGARIESSERQGEAHFRYVLDLPRLMRQGEEHTYVIVFQVPPGHPIRPHYAFVPLVSCDSFDLQVRFHPERLPRAVWRLNQLAPRRLTDEPSPGEALTLDDACEVHLTFSSPKQGFGYGVGWLPATGVAATTLP